MGLASGPDGDRSPWRRTRDLTGGSLGLILGLMKDLLGIVYDPVNGFLGGFGSSEIFSSSFFLHVDLLGRLVLYVMTHSS